MSPHPAGFFSGNCRKPRIVRVAPAPAVDLHRLKAAFALAAASVLHAGDWRMIGPPCLRLPAQSFVSALALLAGSVLTA